MASRDNVFMIEEDFRLPSELSLGSADIRILIDDETNSGTLPRKPASEYEAFDKLKRSVEECPNDLKRWDKVFTALDDKFEQLYDPDQSTKPENGSDIDSKFKEYVRVIYQDLLNRFPYLSEYWKKYLILEYKLNGIQSSIDVLEDSVRQFPHSIDLWSDYLSALISQYELIEDTSKREEQIKFIKGQFGVCLDKNGLHFNSDPLWDSYINFEKSLNENQESSKDILRIYLKLIRIPLYQYAQYFNSFVEINKSFEISEIIEGDDLSEYLQKFQKSSIDELSLIEKHQIIDDYSYAVFTKTQQAVNDKWTFESSLTIQGFNILDLDSTEQETEKWNSYLNFEINNLKKLESSKEKERQFQFDIIIELFERSLIPNCLFNKSWLKYLAFISIFQEESDSKYARIKGIYDRAVSKFIPLNETYFRFTCVDFLMKYDKFEIANEYLFDLIKLYLGQTNNKMYHQREYLLSVRELLKLWSNYVPSSVIISTLDDIITSYFDEVDRYKSKTNEETSKYEFKPAYVSTLENLLNDQSICIIISEYLEYLKLYPDSSNPTKIREFFNKYFQVNAVAKSTLFWKFFVEYEGMIQHNMTNLKRIISFMKSYSSLPKSVVDALLDLNYEIISANYAQTLKESNGFPEESIISYNCDISNSLVMNKSAGERIIHNNHFIHSDIETRLSRGRQQTPLDTKESLLRLARKQADSPGLFRDFTPEITNKIEDKWIPLNTSEIETPPLPTFKNVEKAASSFTHPK